MKDNDALEAERQKLLASITPNERALLKRHGITLSDNPTIEELNEVMPKIEELEREALKRLRSEH